MGNFVEISLGMKYTPADMFVAAKDNGFKVTRSYAGATKNEQGQYIISKGSKVEITIKMVKNK